MRLLWLCLSVMSFSLTLVVYALVCSLPSVLLSLNSSLLCGDYGLCWRLAGTPPLYSTWSFSRSSVLLAAGLEIHAAVNRHCHRRGWMKLVVVDVADVTGAGICLVVERQWMLNYLGGTVTAESLRYGRLPVSGAACSRLARVRSYVLSTESPGHPRIVRPSESSKKSIYMWY